MQNQNESMFLSNSFKKSEYWIIFIVSTVVTWHPTLCSTPFSTSIWSITSYIELLVCLCVRACLWRTNTTVCFCSIQLFFFFSFAFYSNFVWNKKYLTMNGLNHMSMWKMNILCSNECQNCELFIFFSRYTNKWIRPF